jgi:hypothetical protein
MSTVHRRDARAAAALIACVAATILTGCSSSPAQSTAANTSTTSRTAGTTANAAGQAHPIDVCATLGAASASQLTGQPITTADTITGLMPNEYGCAYGNDDDSLQVEVKVFEHDAAFTYNTFASGSPNATTVSGLGDKAFYDGDGTLYVLSGSDLIQVNGLDSADQCAALARPVLAAL